MTNEVASMMETTKQLALVAEAMKRQTGSIVQEFQHATQGIRQTAASAKGDVIHIIQSAGDQVAQSARQGVDQALSQGASRYEQNLMAVAGRLNDAAQQFEHAAQVLSANAQRKLLMGYAAIGGAAVLLIIGGGLLLSHYQRAIDDARIRTDAAQVSAELYEAYAKANVTSCGGLPCVKLDAKSPRWGSKEEYILLEAVPSQGKGVAKP